MKGQPVRRSALISRVSGWSALAVTAALALAGVASSSVHAVATDGTACAPGTTVQTAAGPVCGLVVGGDQEYLGIPYAAAPTDALRWQPPQPHAHWESPLQATQPGQDCIGFRTGSVHAGATAEARDILAGAYHSSDVPALFPGWNSSGLGRANLLVGADQAAMIAEAMDYWGAFARQGAPKPANLPAWQGYRPAGGTVMSLQAAYNSRAEDAATISADHNCGFWAHIPEH